MRQVKTSPMKLNLVAKLVSLQVSLAPVALRVGYHFSGCSQIRGMRVTDAIAQMQFSPKKAARFVLTVSLAQLNNIGCYPTCMEDDYRFPLPCQP